MKQKMIAAALGIVIGCSAASAAVVPYAVSFCGDSERAIGLIEKCSLYVSAQEEGHLYITAKTQVSGVMEELGYNDITVQRSDDGESWDDELRLGSITEENTRYHSLDAIEVSVSGGHYYRVTCVHYARGVPFAGDTPQVQTLPNISNAVWVEAESVPDPEPEPVSEVCTSLAADEPEPAVTTVSAAATYTVTSQTAAVTSAETTVTAVSASTTAVSVSTSVQTAPAILTSVTSVSTAYISSETPAVSLDSQTASAGTSMSTAAGQSVTALTSAPAETSAISAVSVQTTAAAAAGTVTVSAAVPDAPSDTSPQTGGRYPGKALAVIFGAGAAGLLLRKKRR